MTARLGVIAEDQSDVDVIKELVAKVLPAHTLTFRRFIGRGAGKIRGKCHAWAVSLWQQRCTFLVLVHDLDENDLAGLRQALDQALKGCPFSRKVIVIPVREIEAWLLSDHQAIGRALKLKSVPARVANPESILRPKERLAEIIYLKSGKTKYYVNTIHNKRIAAEISLPQIRRCPSFHPFEDFLLANVM